VNIEQRWVGSTRGIESVAAAIESVGQSLGTTDWLSVTQEMVNHFADVTGDHQWIHVDPILAAEGPFGACIAHGLLTLSLAGGMSFHDLVRTAATRGVNYGSDKVRYPAPVRVGARIRGQALILEAEPVAGDGVQLKVRIAVEIEDGAKPGCVADFIARYYFSA
jgi:acyl dehydratase